MMPWSLLVAAIGLMFVFEGILPFSAPHFWRRWMQQMLVQQDRSLRVVGLISMLVGLGLVVIARLLF
jgi:uncharacterized protein YjeT (DUF2065 family)